MSTAGSTPAQSKVFIEEMKRRARRQVLGALALLFLSLTVLPVLFEKRPMDRSSPPRLRWETTPPAPQNILNPSPGTPITLENEDAALLENPAKIALNKTKSDDGLLALNDDDSSQPGRQNSTAPIKVTFPQKNDAAIPASDKTASSRAFRLSDDDTRPASKTDSKTLEKKTADKKAAPATNTTKPKSTTSSSTRTSQEKAASSQNRDIGELRNDELYDSRPTPKKRSKAVEGESVPESRYKKIDDEGNQDLTRSVYPARATKTVIDEEGSSSPDTAVPRAFKKRLEDESTSASKPSSSQYVVQLAALGSEDKAMKLKDHLGELGLNAYIQRTTTKQNSHVYRVRLGPYTRRDSAEKALRTLQNQGYSAILTPIRQSTSSAPSR